MDNGSQSNDFYSAILGYIDLNSNKMYQDSGVNSFEYLAAKKEVMLFSQMKRDGVEPGFKLSPLAFKLLKFVAESIKNSENIEELIKVGKNIQITNTYYTPPKPNPTPEQVNQQTLQNSKSVNSTESVNGIIKSLFTK